MQWEEFAAANAAALPFVGVSCGTGGHDFHKAGSILGVLDVPFVCLDVANGYTEFFVDHVRKVREAHPRVTIIAGTMGIERAVAVLNAIYCGVRKCRDWGDDRGADHIWSRYRQGLLLYRSASPWCHVLIFNFYYN